MTRVRASDYELKKQVILDSAVTLIAQKGFDGATMSDVAAACGTSKSHLYHYFSSKEDLLYAIVKEHITEQVATLSAIVQEPRPAAERFRRFVDSFMQEGAKSRNHHLVIMNDIKFLPTVQREDVRKLERELMHLMVTLLREINPERMATPKVNSPYALLLFGMVIWSFTWYERNGPITPAELADRISALFLDGFRGS
ncbi:TetR/AcrR family transcriptional regulator [Hydrogenophaga laconesensis]|uniref:AcrR family transcriptional regulator n=1 Tax=Hydrogenophaga laconesensis TaxID=1805971 RepID=A0ABU1V6M2_9BURK|nr:TetR/AcrR family transcriptional regulator [Hydrogenophaga laconesensis]MDR7093094.1 AcrR family transcriptional regulator [Hydrogenophaga laconesensis]